MSKKPLILGIESSCDETAASLITENEEGFPVVLSNIVSSQVEVHKEFGGVVPELAARSHIEKIDWIVKKAIDESGRKIEEIEGKVIDEKYYIFYLENNGNKINIFFDKNTYNLVGWQTEDIYQNLVITYIYNLVKNSKIDEKLFILPKTH